MLQELNTICPVIEHLVLCEPFDGGNDHIVHSRTLRWLDLWFGEGLYVYGVPSLAEWETDYARKAIIDAKSEVPALQAVRALVAPHCERWFTPLHGTPQDIPEVCAPDLVGGRLLEAGECVVHRFPTRWVVQTAQVVSPYDAEEMVDVVAMIARHGAVSPNEVQALPRWGLLGWEFDFAELRRIQRNLKVYRQEYGETELADQESDTDDEGENEVIEDMAMEDEAWTGDEDMEEEYLEWNGSEDEFLLESPVVQLDREAILAAFSSSQNVFEDAYGKCEFYELVLEVAESRSASCLLKLAAHPLAWVMRVDDKATPWELGRT